MDKIDRKKWVIHPQIDSLAVAQLDKLDELIDGYNKIINSHINLVKDGLRKEKIMEKMNYKTERERAYYQLGHCAGYGEMGREILGYLITDNDKVNLSKFKECLCDYIELEKEYSDDMLLKLQKKLNIKTLDGSMADENLIYKEKK